MVSVGRNFESTFSGLTYVRMIVAWRSSDCRAKLVFHSLTPENAIATVAVLVAQDGHDVPAAAIRRRFVAGLHIVTDGRGAAGGRQAIMTTKRESKLPDADMQAVPTALRRAAKRAREIARQTGTAVVVVRDGKRVVEKVEPNESDGQ